MMIRVLRVVSALMLIPCVALEYLWARAALNDWTQRGDWSAGIPAFLCLLAIVVLVACLLDGEMWDL